MNQTFQGGLMVGKFCPMHRGHERAIRAMLGACEEGFTLSYTNPGFSSSEPAKRRRWLAHLSPQARVLVLSAHEAPPSA